MQSIIHTVINVTYAIDAQADIVGDQIINQWLLFNYNGFFMAFII